MKEYEKAALIYSLKESNTLVLRIILISILFVGVISCAIYLYNLAISLFDSNPTSVQISLKRLVQHMAQHYFYCIITVHFCSYYFCLGLTFFLKKPENRAFFLISACPVNRHAAAAIPDDLLWPGQIVFQEHLLPFHE